MYRNEVRTIGRLFQRKFNTNLYGEFNTLGLKHETVDKREGRKKRIG